MLSPRAWHKRSAVVKLYNFLTPGESLMSNAPIIHFKTECNHVSKLGGKMNQVEIKFMRQNVNDLTIVKLFSLSIYM